MCEGSRCGSMEGGRDGEYAETGGIMQRQGDYVNRRYYVNLATLIFVHRGLRRIHRDSDTRSHGDNQENGFGEAGDNVAEVVASPES
jgi:hypothetical protein